MQPPRDESGDRRAMWQGMNDGLAQAVEMAVTPVLCCLIGLFIDGRVGTTPGFALAFFFFAIVGTFIKAFCVYRYQSEQFERERRPWVKPSR